MYEPGSYQLKRIDNIIAAKFTGRWSSALDLQFMNELCGEMNTVRRCGAWAFFVDMRQWEMRDEVINTAQQIKVELDRRNQKSECWLIEDERQGHFLLPLFETMPFSLQRYKDQASVMQWLKHTGFESDKTISLIDKIINN